MRNNQTEAQILEKLMKFNTLIASIIKKTVALVIEMLSKYEITPTWKLNYLHILMAIVAVLIVILNTYVISLFTRKKNLRKKSNLFLLSLTISDELVGSIVIPVFIMGQMMQGTKKVSTWPVAQRFSHISFIFLTFCSLLSISNLCAVTLDRCYHLCSPFKYQGTMTKTKFIIILVIIWLCCSVFAVSSFIYYYPIYKYEVKREGYFEVKSMLEIMKGTERPNYCYMLVLHSVSIALTAVTAILLIMISKVILKSRRHTLRTFQQRTKRRNEIKSAVILTIMFGTMLVWLTPVFYYFFAQQMTETSMGMHLGRFSISVINPVLFTLFKTDFWKILQEDKARLTHIMIVAKRNLDRIFVGVPQRIRRTRTGEYRLSSEIHTYEGEIATGTITIASDM